MLDDFDEVQHLRAAGPCQHAAHHAGDREAVRRAGTIIGTPEYMSPQKDQEWFCNGITEEARRVLTGLDRLARKRYVPPWARAIIHIGLGQKSRALDWLEKGCEEHDGWLWTLSRDPWYDPLRKEPRFQALLKKVGPNR